MPVMLVYDHIIAEIRLIRDQMSIVCKVEEDIDFRGVTTLQELILRVNELDEISVGCMDFEAETLRSYLLSLPIAKHHL